MEDQLEIISNFDETTHPLFGELFYNTDELLDFTFDNNLLDLTKYKLVQIEKFFSEYSGENLRYILESERDGSLLSCESNTSINPYFFETSSVHLEVKNRMVTYFEVEPGSIENIDENLVDFGTIEIKNLTHSWNICEFYYSIHPSDQWSDNLIEEGSVNVGEDLTYTIPVNTYSVKIKDDWNYEFILQDIEVTKDSHTTLSYDGFNFTYFQE